MCNQQPGGNGELPPLQFTKSRKILRKFPSQTQRVRTSGNSQGEVSGVSQGPPTTPDLCASSLAPLQPSAPRRAVGRVAPSTVTGLGQTPRGKCGYSASLLPFPQGRLSFQPHVFFAKGRDYFVHEELNLLRLPNGAEISPLSP